MRNLAYVIGLWPKLTRFLEHPVLELSNNAAENSMRPPALGRKNWIHLGSVAAAPRVAAVLSVFESCRRLGVPLRGYLASVLPGLADRPLTVRVKATQACGREAAMVKWRDGREAELGGEAGGGAGV